MTIPTFKASHRTITVLIVVAGVLFLVAVMTYVMMNGKLSDALAEMQQKQKQVEGNHQIAKRLKSAEETYLRAQNEIGFLETSVSSEAYVPTMLKQLESLGKSLNMRVVSVRPEPPAAAAPPPIKRTSEEGAESTASSNVPAAAPEKPKPYEELKINIELEGSYWNARNFIDRLTRFPKIVAVQQVQMSPASTKTTLKRSPTLLVKLSLTAFIFPVQTPPVQNPGAQPAAPLRLNEAKITGRSVNEG